MQKLLATLLFLVVAGGTNAADKDIPQIGSAAELWRQRTPTAKQAYLEGYCEGSGGGDLGRIECGEFGKIDSTAGPHRFPFCGSIWAIKGVPSGITYLDGFYQDRNHSDVPIHGAIRVFNDKACKEKNSNNNIEKLQAKFLCLRNASNMAQMGVSSEVLRKQYEQCASLPLK